MSAWGVGSCQMNEEPGGHPDVPAPPFLQRKQTSEGWRRAGLRGQCRGAGAAPPLTPSHKVLGQQEKGKQPTKQRVKGWKRRFSKEDGQTAGEPEERCSPALVTGKRESEPQ